MILFLLLLFSTFTATDQLATSIQFHKKDAVVWHPEQIISGEISGFEVDIVTVFHDDFPLPIRLDHEKKFSFDAILKNQENKFWITVESEDLVRSSR